MLQFSSILQHQNIHDKLFMKSNSNTFLRSINHIEQQNGKETTPT